MKRCLIRVLVLGLLLGLSAWSGRVDAQGDKTPDIKTIMGKLNKPTGIYFGLARELKDQAPMWDEVKPQARLLAQLAASLPRNSPPKGDKASWDSQVKAYLDNAQAVERAVQKMDKAAAQAALARMGEPTCTNCHKAHRQ